MIGGHNQEPSLNELVFSFEFPEKPGTLINFLDALGDRWSISMFHYRNQGADFGRVLVAIQAEENDRAAIISFLDGIAYRYWDETDNPAFKLFLS